MSVQGYRNSERLPVCVRVYVCMSATFVARLVAIKDEDGDTCLVVFGWNARKRCLPLWHRFFSILVTRSSTLIHEFVAWKYDLVSRLVSVERITGIFVAMFCWFASMSWRPCGRSFVRKWFFTSFPTCIYVFSGIIMNTIEDNCYVIFSLSLFLRFQLMLQRYKDRNGRWRNIWRNERRGEKTIKFRG